MRGIGGLGILFEADMEANGGIDVRGAVTIARCAHRIFPSVRWKIPQTTAPKKDLADHTYCRVSTANGRPWISA